MMIKKRNLFLILMIFYLSGCGTGDSKKTELKPLKIAQTKTDTVKPVVSAAKVVDTIGKYDYKYIFCNDKTCQQLFLKVLSKTKEYNMPEKLKFKLVLSEKASGGQKKEITGIAKITSPNESFFDATEADPADYFAADYGFTTPDYEINIRLDIEKYNACVVYLYSYQNKGKFINHYIKKYPGYDVLKKVK